MEQTTQPDSSPMHHLTSYLTARREALLTNWRNACMADANMPNESTLSREEFNDLVPALLSILNKLLLNQTTIDDPVALAAEHGLHRWHKGYELIELLQETNYLSASILAEIANYGNLYPQTPKWVLQKVYMETCAFVGQLVKGSVLKYDELKTLAAASRSETLQTALDNLNQLEQQRGELMRMTSHDIQSGLGIMEGAAHLLNRQESTAEEQQQLFGMMQRNLSTVRDLIQRLTELARLEAGQETLDLEQFDATKLLKSLVESHRPLADDRGIALQANGPTELMVESDRIKLQRIIQNLLMNAIQYIVVAPSQPALISVSWAEAGENRWFVSIQDTGPGLPPGPVRRLAIELTPTQEPARINSTDEEIVSELNKQSPATIPTRASGEGLGLHIVKRLCEILFANMDVEVIPNAGTLFRIHFPKHWPR